MAGEGVGGSVGELEMAAWLQQVEDDDDDADDDVKKWPCLFEALIKLTPGLVQACPNSKLPARRLLPCPHRTDHPETPVTGHHCLCHKSKKVESMKYEKQNRKKYKRNLSLIHI